ncbi:MAG: hypothetical protein JWO30_3853 [Fibrobacteres bacterium]|nr:hypothetical protein [Fibrobacterota bacterium]
MYALGIEAGASRVGQVMYKNRKKYLRTVAMGASLANGYWASITQSGHGANWSPVVLAMLSVWVCYFSVAWLVEGMRSK